MEQCIALIFRLFGRLPLPVLHILATLLGNIGYWLSPTLRQRTTENLQQSAIITDKKALRRATKAVLCESLKGGFELAIAWTRSTEYIVHLFQRIEGWEHIQAAIEKQQGLLLITPHLGSYDLAGRMISEQLPFPLTAMYRPPKKAWLEPIMNAGRARAKGKTAPANAQGVRQVVRALKQKEAVIILPDQVPQSGEGVLGTFFGKKAYSMTLAARLAKMNGICPLLFVGERLPHGKGFVLHIVPFEGELTGEKRHDVQQINHNVEALIRRFPTQYLFSYNRYKLPAGVDDTPETDHAH